MEKRIVDKIKALQGSAASQEEFMKQLAGIDEKGQLTEEFQVAVNGGAASVQFDFGTSTTAGMFPPIKLPTEFTLSNDWYVQHRWIQTLSMSNISLPT